MSTVGLDVGTSRVKAVRFDESWEACDTVDELTTVLRGVDGAREQDMAQVWAAAERVLGAVVARSPDGVDLVAVTAQGDGCWLVDGALRPVGNAMLWNDNRAVRVVEGWQDDGTLDEAFALSGCLVSSGVAAAQLRWLLDHDPDRVRRAERLLSCGSWVFANLTGREVVDASEAANPFSAARTGSYDERLLDLFGLGALDRLLPDRVGGPDRVAGLLPEVAARLGLPPDTPVALGPYDVPSTAVGTGSVRPGLAFAVLGTTLCTGVVNDSPRLNRPAGGMTLPLHEPGRWLVAYATMVGTEILDWATRLLGLPDVARLAELAATSTRSDVPLLLPYLSPAGERSPFLDASMRGSLLGLDVSHTPADVARATFEGLSLALADCVRAAGAPERLALSGGGARSRFWCQQVADATGLPVHRPDCHEVGARGAVLVGSTALGAFTGLDDAVGIAVREGEPLVPDPGAAARLAERFEELVELRGRLADG